MRPADTPQCNPAPGGPSGEVDQADRAGHTDQAAPTNLAEQDKLAETAHVTGAGDAAGVTLTAEVGEAAQAEGADELDPGFRALADQHTSPQFSEAVDLFELGVARMGAGDSAAAVAAFSAALQLAPGLVEAHINLGLLLEPSDAAQAERHFRAAVAADPLRVAAHVQLGAMLAAQKRFAEAEHCYRQALLIDPAASSALSNLGVLLVCTGREAQAMACYRAAIASAPDHPGAHLNLAYLLLRDGNFEAGWPEFEHRAWYARFGAYFNFPRWTGQPLQGRSLLIGVEAGHGDMIQFCRYASLLRQQGAKRVGIICHSGLRRLFATLEGIDQVFDLELPVPRDGWDFWAPPLSMPYRFGTRLDTIPAVLPYLRADPALCGLLDLD
ncbi:MAG: tetratricopeptide repeat protein, partial [Massilia sp.]